MVASCGRGINRGAPRIVLVVGWGWSVRGGISR